VQQRRALGVRGVALRREHLVKVAQLLAQLVVVALDARLRLDDDARDLAALERRVLGHAQEVEHALDLVGAKEAEDPVVEREEEV